MTEDLSAEIPCAECEVFIKTKTHPDRALMCETARACGDCLIINRLEAVKTVIKRLEDLHFEFLEPIIKELHAATEG